MRSLESGESTPIAVRLSPTDRAEIVGQLAALNQAIESEEWFKITKKVTASQAVRLALRCFWSDWQSCQAIIRAFYACRIPRTSCEWVISRLLFAMISNEVDGFACRSGRPSKLFSKDPKVCPFVYCGWRRSVGGSGIAVIWGVFPAPVGETVTLKELVEKHSLVKRKFSEAHDDLFNLCAGFNPAQLQVFGACP